MSNKLTRDSFKNLDSSLDFEIETNLKIKENDILIDKYNDNITRFIFTYNNNNTNYSNYYFKILKNKNTDENINNYCKCNILLVGGGGGGGYNIGGGGGGGRVVYMDNVLLKTNKKYKIEVGSGGEGGNKDYYSGDTGYSSSISKYIALGGGGGGSYTSSKLIEDNINNIKKAKNDSIGLDGGSGGGNCIFVNDFNEKKIKKLFGMNKDTDENNTNILEKNFESFGNNGGTTTFNKELDKNLEILKTKHKGAGGGGANSNGQNTLYNELINSDFQGNGGNGISIEEISNKRYCQIALPDLSIDNKNNYCKNIENTNLNLKYLERDNNLKLQNLKRYYWGAGGGGGSINTFPGKGGIGGGGGGGYYETSGQKKEEVYNFIEYQDNDKKNNIIKINKEQNKSYGNISDTPIEILDNYISAKGGNGINHTGSGGGGGGYKSNGGDGGSGIVILLINNEDYEIKKNYKSIIEAEEKLLILNNKFKKNKYILGTNLSSLYHYYIKEYTYFFEYIEKIYENEILDNKKKFLFNYDISDYDSKFHLYIKLIFDLKIEKDQFLYYENNILDNLNYNNDLNPQKNLLLLLIHIIEDILEYLKNNNIDNLQKFTDIKLIYNENRNDNINNIEYYKIENNTITFYYYNKNNNNNYEFTSEQIKNTNDENIKETDIILIYLKIILYSKKHNFNKNLLALYIFFINIKILEDLYFKSEIFLKKSDSSYLINELDNLVYIFDNKINYLKKLYGFEFIDYYIDREIFNNIKLKKSNYPKISFIINNKDNIDFKDSDFINNFLVEIDNNNLKNRYPIKNVTKKNNNIYIDIIVNDKKDYEYINEDILYNIKLTSKDETFIKDSYNNDVEKIKEYNNNIYNIKLNLQKISENYNNNENLYNNILTKSYIYYTIIAILSFLIFLSYISNTNTNTISLLISVSIIIIIITIIYNNLSKIHLDNIENFNNYSFEKPYRILHEFKLNFNSYDNFFNNKEIIIPDDNNIKKKLKIETLNKLDSDSDIINNYINNHEIIIKINNNEKKYKISYLNFYDDDNCFPEYIYKKYKCIYKISINDSDNYINKNNINLNEDITIKILEYKNTLIENLYNPSNYIVNNNIKEVLKEFINEYKYSIQKDTQEYIRLEKIKYIYLIRDNLLSFINNKFIEINKIINNIELQKSNEIYNTVNKALQKEKKNYNQYKKEYTYNKNYNENLNKIYRHKFMSQNNLNNFILNFYLILIISLLFYILFPYYYSLIIIILIFSITINIIIYTIKEKQYTRKDAYRKYWFKPNEKDINII